MEHVIQINKANGNMYLYESMKKKVDDVIELDCFEFKNEGLNSGVG